MLLEVRETLTRADHQTHRRYSFSVPPECQRLAIHVAYAPKHLDARTSAGLAQAALAQHTAALANRVGADRARDWAADLSHRVETVRIPNLLTVSIDDAQGVYRGAGHRQSPDQHLFIAQHDASPGFSPGPLPAGAWTLVLSAHTLVSDQCAVSIQIGADMPTSTPRAVRRSA